MKKELLRNSIENLKEDKLYISSKASKAGISYQGNPSVIGKASTAGITLVALVVTIVVLLILSGITITYVFGNNGVLDQALKAKEATQIAKLKERIEIIHKDWWIDKKLDPTVTLDDLWDRLIADNIIKSKDDVAGPEKEGENDKYILDTTEGYLVDIIINPDGSIEIGDISKGDKLPPQDIEEGTVRQKGETVWANSKASIELESTNEKLAIQYQINGIDGTWIPYEGAIGDLNHNDTVYAVLTDGKNYGDIATVEIRDGGVPTAVISGLSSSVTAGSTISATVTHSDNESGVNLQSCKWIFKTSSTKIGTDENLYTGTFSSESEKITWSTSSTGTYYLHVLTVDNAGNKEEIVSSSSVRVNPKTVSVTGVSVSPTSVDLDVGSTKQLTATVSPSNASNKSVTWSSSNTSVATVSSTGLVTAKSAGSATITVTTSSGSKTATCSVTVQEIKAESLRFNDSYFTVRRGESIQIEATWSPPNANVNLKWSGVNDYGWISLEPNGKYCKVTGVSADHVVKVRCTDLISGIYMEAYVQVQ